MLHVVVTGVVVALIAAMLLRVTMLRHLVITRSHKAAQMKRSDESSLARLQGTWNLTGNGVCTPFTGYSSCSGSPGACGCVCTPDSATDPVVTATPVGAACRIDIVSIDMMPAP